jgi:hypothetical protein
LCCSVAYILFYGQHPFLYNIGGDFISSHLLDHFLYKGHVFGAEAFDGKHEGGDLKGWGCDLKGDIGGCPHGLLD